MAGQHPSETANLTRSKITDAYEHIDDSDTAGARKRVQMYGRDSSGNPVQLVASDDGSLKVDSDTISGSEYDTTSIDTTDPNEIVITYKLSGVTVATETITVSGSLIEITKT
jgi:hypothetical protein